MTASSLSVASEIVATYDEMLERGEAPAAEDFAAAHTHVPHLLVKLRALIQVRQDLHRSLAGTDHGPPAISGFRLRRLLGRGGMGAVYLAEQESPRRLCAIKVLDGASFAGKARFRREADLAARLQHSGIATVYSFGEEGGVPYLVTEYVPGVSLRRLLDVADAVQAPAQQWFDAAVAVIAAGVSSGAATSPLPVPLAVDLARQLADALAHAHAQGVVHRDIKPSNLMITFDGRLKVIDFGIAVPTHDEGSRVTQTGMFVGSPDYAAPEQILGEGYRIGPATDVWAAGATLYELLTQEPPYGAASTDERIARVREPAPRASTRHRAVPAALDALLRRSLAINPDDRFADGAELYQALTEVAHTSATRGALRLPRLRTDTSDPREVWRTLAGAVLVVIAAVGAFNLGTRRGQDRARSATVAHHEHRDAAVRDWALGRHREALAGCFALPRPESKLLPVPQEPLSPPRCEATLFVLGGKVQRVEVSGFSRWLDKASRECFVRELAQLEFPGVGIDVVATVPVSLEIGR